MQPSTVHSPWWKAIRPKKPPNLSPRSLFFFSPVARYNTSVVLVLTVHGTRKEKSNHAISQT